MLRKEDCLQIGETVGRFGAGLEVLVQLKPPYLNLFKKLDFVLLPVFDSLTPFFIQAIKSKAAFTWIATFEDVDTIEQAQLLEKLPVFVPASFAPDNEKLEGQLDQLIGFQVSDHLLGILGKITGIIDFPHQQLFEIEMSNGKELILPAVKAFIIEIDTAQHIVHVQTPDGLVAIYT